jgi:AcrR family transcriptional regulator
VALREQKKQQTRVVLERVALDLFKAHGYDNTTVEQIAAAAEVSVRTFYRYFAAKDDVLFARWTPVVEQAREAIRQRDRTLAPFASMAEAMASAGAIFEEERDVLLELVALARANPPLHVRQLQEREHWVRVIIEELAADSGRPLDDIRLHVVARMLHGGFQAGLDEWRRTEAGSSLPDAIRTAFAIIRDPSAAVAEVFEA